MTSFLLIITVLLQSCSEPAPPLTPEQAREIAKEAYIYGFPMVMNYKTLYAYTLDTNSPEYKGPFNVKSCQARLFTPEDKAVVTPNSDTPYCMFWSDISAGPVVITVPEIEGGRSYSFQFIDLFTQNFAYVGTLTTGNGPGKYLIAPSQWKGEKPDGISEVIYCETDLFFTIVRTQLMGENDLDQVRALQDSYQLQTLGEYLGEDPGYKAPAIDWPVWNEGDQFTEAAFKYIDLVLNLTQKVDSEKALLEDLARLGIGTPEPFDIGSFDAATREAISAGAKEGFAEIMAFLKKISSDPRGSTKIFGTREFLAQSAKENYGLENMFLLRAAGAQMGLYGNSGFEAMYPTYFVDSEGTPLNGAENDYRITFEKGQLPPVKAFWSLTMYDGRTQLLIDNAIDRYLVNSPMLEDFILGDDGSLTLYIQKESPGDKLEANWLPAPDGPFYCVMRLYGPKEEALSGAWTDPPIVNSK